MRSSVLILISLLAACSGGTISDFDGDGALDDVDCDPQDASIHPGANDPIDRIDQNCDGIDGNDVDGDGYAAEIDDCDDNRATVHPDAAEAPDEGDTCDDNLDNDCDGDTDGHDLDCPSGDDDDTGDDDDDDTGDDDDDDDDTTGLSEVHHDTDVDADTIETWAGGQTHYLSGDLTVYGDLIIESGAVVEIGRSVYYDGVDLIIEGSLTIQDDVLLLFGDDASLIVGASNDPPRGDLHVQGGAQGVLFTSAQATPTAGDWNGIRATGHAGTIEMSGATVEYGGGGIYANLHLYSGTADIAASTFRRAQGNGLELDQYTNPLSFSLSDCVFEDNSQYGLEIDDTATWLGSAPTDLGVLSFGGNGAGPLHVGAAFVQQLTPGNVDIPAGSAEIKVEGGTIESDATWSDLGVPYLMSYGEDITVAGAAEPRLTLVDGVEIRFQPGGTSSDLIIGTSNDAGALTIAGTTQGVLLTTSDNSVDPDTWGGLRFNDGNTSSDISGLEIAYGGDNAFANVYLSGGSLTITDSLIRDSESSGVEVSEGTLDLSGTQVIDNDGEGVKIWSGGALAGFQGNTLTGNGRSGLVLRAPHVALLDPAGTYGPNGGLVQGESVVEISGGDIEQDATWPTLDVPYEIQSEIEIDAFGSPTLTLSAGSTYYLNEYGLLRVGASSGGSLMAEGTSAEPIVMASSDPADNWNCLRASSHAENFVLRHVQLDRGGNYGCSGGLHISGGDAVLDHVTVSNGEAVGLFLYGGSVSINDSTFTGNRQEGAEIYSGATLLAPFAGNTFTNNGAPGTGSATYPGLQIPAPYVGLLDTSSTFTGNARDLIHVTGSDITESVTWHDLGVPYRIAGQIDLTGNASPILTLEPGVELQFGHSSSYDAQLVVGQSHAGGLIAEGTSADPIVFTSAQASPAKSDWEGVELRSNCLPSSTSLDHVVVEYGGEYSQGSVYISHCDASITNSTVQHSGDAGIEVYMASPTISNITYADNDGADCEGC